MLYTLYSTAVCCMLYIPLLYALHLKSTIALSLHLKSYVFVWDQYIQYPLKIRMFNMHYHAFKIMPLKPVFEISDLF